MKALALWQPWATLMAIGATDLEGTIDLDAVLVALKAMRPPLITQETDLHALVASTLRAADIPHDREYNLGPRCRIDFMTAGGTGIECKKGVPNRARLVDQLERYARHQALRALVVVTPWGRHLGLPSSLGGKRLEVVVLNRLWGVAT